MDLLRGLLFISLLILLDSSPTSAQKYLVLDRYGTNRIRIPLGTEVYFKVKGDKKMHHNYITELTDSIVIMGNKDIYLKLDEFDSFYFERRLWRNLRYGTLIPAAGFLISAAVHPLVEEPFYDQSESAVIGLAFIGLGQSFRLLEWKKFKVNRRSRIWVGGWQ